MENFDIGLRHTLEPGLNPELVHKLMGRLKLANFMELPEQGFKDVIREIESDPLFRQLCFAHRKEHKIIGFRRFAKGCLAGQHFELNEEITPQSGSLDVESLVEGRGEIVEIIRHLGPDRFKECFLYPDENLTIPDIAARCGIPVADAERVTELVNSVFVHHEIAASEFGPAAVDPGVQAPSYSRIASIERGESGFVIAFFLPAMARGRYVINYDRLEFLKDHDVLDEISLQKVRQLLRKLELVNTRKNLTYQILEAITTVQREYLETGDPKDLKPFLLKNLAAMFNVSLGMISRAVHGRSVITQWGERPVRFFFPNQKWSKKELVREVIRQESGRAHSDEEIRAIILERHGVAVSRRAVNAYRLSLRIDSSYARNQTRRQESAS